MNKIILKSNIDKSLITDYLSDSIPFIGCNITIDSIRFRVMAVNIKLVKVCADGHWIDTKEEVIEVFIE